MTESGRPPVVAIIDNAIDPGIYAPVAQWTGFLPAGCAWEAFSARAGKFPDPSRFSHVILTGSEASILEPEPWVLEEAALVREAVAGGLAVLGSCWGHQLLAFALAGPSHVGRAPRPEIGWIRLRLRSGGGLLGPAPGTAFTFSIHFDEVLNAEALFEVLADSALCPNQAMRLRGRPVWGLQCHPEVDIPTGRRFLKDLLESGFKGADEIRRALISTARDSGLIRTIIPAFLTSRG
jgi:GMP synthase-like glutamine amidotransferase